MCKRSFLFLSFSFFCLTFVVFVLFCFFRFIGAENAFNFFTVKKNSEAATDDERRKLEVVGQFHVGDFVNRFRRGSLVMKLPETEISNIDTLLFCTTGGSLGVLATLPATKYQFLHKVQTNLTKIIKGVGGLKHEM